MHSWKKIAISSAFLLALSASGALAQGHVSPTAKPSPDPATLPGRPDPEQGASSDTKPSEVHAPASPIHGTVPHTGGKLGKRVRKRGAQAEGAPAEAAAPANADSAAASKPAGASQAAAPAGTSAPGTGGTPAKAARTPAVKPNAKN